MPASSNRLNPPISSVLRCFKLSPNSLPRGLLKCGERMSERSLDGRDPGAGDILMTCKSDSGNTPTEIIEL
ncbi:hypothetical protein DFA_02557 [Cavenderia fasciculata]|uniref:Uncharacterized protein n=1 Tax=Cavenderia fasciculata TaxID=261658 RepID=F4PZQ4_CACFS|nr:uncharacterized protein DFA_02557 [Cavenderia fasciculata]EGG18818.1 hypothetical protein DFA_02557 [Cavenderia fasciculata]|eukprot:XP_004357280.1 hypothetical protein DFA_02557 [Cavenderia fasciculata]